MTFDKWLRSPVRITQVFVYRVACATDPNELTGAWLPGTVGWMRSTPQGLYRQSADYKAHRARIVSALKRLRAAGVDFRTRRQMALRIINAPESYAGVERSSAGQIVDAEIRAYLVSMPTALNRARHVGER